MSETPPPSPARAGPAGRISASLIEGLHLRLELFALEMSQERDRVVARVVLCVVLALSAFLLLLSLHAALLVVFWDSYRVQVSVAMVAFYAIVVVTSLLMLRRRKRTQEEPFAATQQVLRQDVETLRELGNPPS